MNLQHSQENDFRHSPKAKNTLFQLVDFYTLFYFRFIKLAVSEFQFLVILPKQSTIPYLGWLVFRDDFGSKPYKTNQARPGNFGSTVTWVLFMAKQQYRKAELK